MATPAPQSAALLARLKAVECPDATYPARDPPLVMARGKGSLVEDADGNRYIDLCAGFGVLALGHNAPPLQDVLARHLAQGDALPPIAHGMGDVYASSAKVRLLERLVALMPPSLTRAALALTGGQAVELAVKTAILATRRTGFITFAGGYHGLDLGILPLTSRTDFRAPFTGFYPEGKVATLPFGASEAELSAAFKAFPMAAVVVEAVQGRAGVRPAPPGWLALLRRLCDQNGALLVYDEVFTGLGRTGRLTFASEVPCDLLCLGKALGGSLPLSACVGTEKAMRAWPESTGEALHTGTFFGHALACEAALATLDAIVAQDLPGRAREVGGRAKAFLQERLAGHRAVTEIRGEGLMLAVAFAKDGAGARAMDLLRQRGVIALASGDKGESVSLTPALNIPEDLLGDALHRLIQVADFLT